MGIRQFIRRYLCVCCTTDESTRVGPARVSSQEEARPGIELTERKNNSSCLEAKKEVAIKDTTNARHDRRLDIQVQGNYSSNVARKEQISTTNINQSKDGASMIQEPVNPWHNRIPVVGEEDPSTRNQSKNIQGDPLEQKNRIIQTGSTSTYEQTDVPSIDTINNASVTPEPDSPADPQQNRRPVVEENSSQSENTKGQSLIGLKQNNNRIKQTGSRCESEHEAAELAFRKKVGTLLYTNEGLIYWSEPNKHAEQVFIEKTGDDNVLNIHTIWIKNSPCNSKRRRCANKLINHFASKPNKPTIYIGKIWKKERPRNEKGLRRMKELGFHLKAWYAPGIIEDSDETEKYLKSL